MHQLVDPYIVLFPVHFHKVADTAKDGLGTTVSAYSLAFITQLHVTVTCEMHFVECVSSTNRL